MDYEGTLEVTFLLAALIISLVSPTDSNETINFELFLSVENLTKDGTVLAMLRSSASQEENQAILQFASTLPDALPPNASD